VSKRFGSVVALRELTLEVHDREFQQAPGDVGLGRGRSLVESSGIEGVPGS